MRLPKIKRRKEARKEIEETKKSLERICSVLEGLTAFDFKFLKEDDEENKRFQNTVDKINSYNNSVKDFNITPHGLKITYLPRKVIEAIEFCRLHGEYYKKQYAIDMFRKENKHYEEYV